MAWLTVMSGVILMVYAGLRIPYVVGEDVNFLLGTAATGAVLMCIGIAVV
jgi:hypothetical protein